MNCKYHSEVESVGKCAVCGAPLCEKCMGVQTEFSACPKCSKKYMQNVYNSYKSGLTFNILSVCCFLGFLVLYVIDLFKSMKTLYIVLGAIVVAILGPLCVVLLIYTIKKIKRLKKLINDYSFIQTDDINSEPKADTQSTDSTNNKVENADLTTDKNIEENLTKQQQPKNDNATKIEQKTTKNGKKSSKNSKKAAKKE